MELVTTAFANVVSLAGLGLDFVSGEPLFMIPIGFGIVSAAVYFVKGLI